MFEHGRCPGERRTAGGAQLVTRGRPAKRGHPTRPTIRGVDRVNRVKPSDLSSLVAAGRPIVLPSGDIVVTVSRPDLETNSTVSRLVQIAPDGSRRNFTNGPKDSRPVLSPDGRTLVFNRGSESGAPQLFAMAVDGGEARQLTDHKLGAGSPVFSPDGRRLAYQAAVPEAGRYGTDDKTKPDAEAPRMLTQLSYRRDGKGFLLDRPEQLFLIDLDHSDLDRSDSASGPSQPAAVQLTDLPAGVGSAVFSADGTGLLYVREARPDSMAAEIVRIDIAELPTPATESTDPNATPASAAPTPTKAVGSSDPETTSPTVPESVVVVEEGRGYSQLLVDDGILYFLAQEFENQDFVGATAGLFAATLSADGRSAGKPKRLTDPETVELEDAPLVPTADGILVLAEHRGAVELLSVPRTADRAALDTLPVLLGGQRVVRAFSVAVPDNGNAGSGATTENTSSTTTLAATIGTPESFCEVITAELNGTTITNERQLTDLGAELTASGIAEMIELTGQGEDGYPVHGWLVLPKGDGPHPVILNVHGGPHAQYAWGLFDEAQVYAGAGYAVVMGNPRGSSGYGFAHGRSVKGRLGTVDAADVLALLDTALQRDDLDPDRVGVMGGSYGGFMTSWLASHAGDRFAAGISERAVNAWDSFAGSSDIGYFFAREYCTPEGEEPAGRDKLWADSPLAYADQISMPFLVIHSEEDWRCPIEQGQRMFVALKQRGNADGADPATPAPNAPETAMLVFPGEGHELSRSGKPRHRLQRFDAILNWWNKHLPVDR